jgi:glyoxylase-like metal-dependent hydrolase (beta-lactamase superfamily II)
MEIIQLLVGQMDVYCYLLGCRQNKNAAIIDPGGNAAQIKREADRRGYNIKYIINTHAHFDHTLGNKGLKDLTGAKLLLHQEDAELLASPEMQMMCQSMGYEPSPLPDAFLTDNQVIELGEGDEDKMTILHTPGHSLGGVCILIYGNPPNIITGDTLFVGAVGRTDFPGGSWPEMRRSIMNRILALPDNTVVWPGHNYGLTPTSTVAIERRSNPYLQ